MTNCVVDVLQALTALGLIGTTLDTIVNVPRWVERGILGGKGGELGGIRRTLKGDPCDEKVIEFGAHLHVPSNWCLYVFVFPIDWIKMMRRY